MTPTASQAPVIRNSRTGVIIRHVEYIADITSTNAFTNRQYELNPGIGATFPWLSEIANSFEQYKWRGLVFTYKSTSADLTNAGSGALGTVIMATDYDALDPGYATKQEMENAEFTKSAKPSVSFVHPVETARGQSPYKLLYTREDPVPPNGDRRLYDLGVFQLATTGMPASGEGTAIGELWVSYEIEFLKPQFHQHGNPLAVHLQGKSAALVSGTDLFGYNAGVHALATMPGSTLGVTQLNGLTLQLPGNAAGKTFQMTFTLYCQTQTGTGTTIIPQFDLSVGANQVAIVPGVFFGIDATLAANQYVYEYVNLVGNDKRIVWSGIFKVPPVILSGTAAIVKLKDAGSGSVTLSDINELDVMITEIPASMTI